MLHEENWIYNIESFNDFHCRSQWGCALDKHDNLFIIQSILYIYRPDIQIIPNHEIRNPVPRWI